MKAPITVKLPNYASPDKPKVTYINETLVQGLVEALAFIKSLDSCTNAASLESDYDRIMDRAEEALDTYREAIKEQ